MTVAGARNFAGRATGAVKIWRVVWQREYCPFKSLYQALQLPVPDEGSAAVSSLIFSPMRAKLKVR